MQRDLMLNGRFEHGSSVCVSSRLVLVEQTIPQADDAGAALDHAFIVRNEDHGFTSPIQLVENIENFIAALGIEIPRGFICEDH